MNHLEQFKQMLEAAGRDYTESVWEGETVIVPSQPKGSVEVRLNFTTDGSFGDVIGHQQKFTLPEDDCVASEAILNFFRRRKEDDGNFKWTNWRKAYKQQHWERYGCGTITTIRKSLVADGQLEIQKEAPEFDDDGKRINAKKGRPSGFVRATGRWRK